MSRPGNRTTWRAWVAGWLCLLLWAGNAGAQEDAPVTAPLNFGVLVTESISERAVFDWWQVRLSAGDTLTVSMTGSDGLAPLIGLLNENNDLIGRSDEGDPNSEVTLTYTAEESGAFRIVATRAGNADGTTTGNYTLLATRQTPQVEAIDPYREVLFTCEDGNEYINLLTLEIEEDAEQTEVVRVSVYGLEGAEPILRNTLVFDFDQQFDQFCARGNQLGPGGGDGDILALPGTERITFDGGIPKTNFQPPEAFEIQVNVGTAALDGGRYVVVIDGFVAAPGGDRDLLEVGLGPRVRDTSLAVYAIGDKNTRLDTFVERIDEGVTVLEACDDAGQRDCEQLASMADFYWYASETDKAVTGGRFDGGLLLEPGTPEKQRLLFGGFDGRTDGGYTVVIIGEVPAATD